jgi:hypothetical protein
MESKWREKNATWLAEQQKIQREINAIGDESRNISTTASCSSNSRNRPKAFTKMPLPK